MTSTKRHPAHVAILLATYNGELFLGEQLATLQQQEAVTVDIWASDDGSSDRTQTILEKTQSAWRGGSFNILNGPGRGFSENFRSLILCPDVRADYYAFCDQDDLWDADKLAAAVEWLTSLPATQPGLYCSRTRIVNSKGQSMGMSPLFSKPASFRNAIVQSIAGGNTMVLNQRAWSLLVEASRQAAFVSHDWWAYLVVAGAGGAINYSPEARIGYRQHSGNLVGSNNGLDARLSRYKFLLEGRFSGWMERNLSGLRGCDQLLTDDAKRVLAEMERVHSGILPARLASLVRSGAYRQSAAANMGLYLAALLGKL